MEEKIILSFADNDKYRLEFSPFDFWANFAAGYKGLPWEEETDGKLSIIAENYSYLLDLLVQARLFYLSGKREDANFQ
jgi:hypothetical protein